MKIAIVGAGAMGSIFGARLTAAGHDTVLVDVSATVVDALNNHGVTTTRGDRQETTKVRASIDPGEVGPVDLVVFCTKCYHTAAAATAAEPLVAGDTVVASLQNGWGNGDVLVRAFGPERVVVGVTYNSGLLTEPGHVVHPSDQPTIVGALDGGNPSNAELLATALGEAGFDTRVAVPVQQEIWKKLILNAACLPAAALAGATSGTLTSNDELHELVSETAVEATAVATALGFEIDAQERIDTIHSLLGQGAGSKASMLQDFEAGRRTEIDVINGAVVAAADEVGVSAPVNRALVRLVKGWETARGLV
jgi:2-dehydropantoate 2-reductase